MNFYNILLIKPSIRFKAALILTSILLLFQLVLQFIDEGCTAVWRLVLQALKLTAEVLKCLKFDIPQEYFFTSFAVLQRKN